MYEPPSEYTNLVEALNNAPATAGCGKTIVNVEIVLRLAENLGVSDEPITVGWVLLAGTPIRNEKLRCLTPKQRHMLANARQLIPLNSRFAWEAALRDYTLIPTEHRNYDFESTDLAERIIDACKVEPRPYPTHINLYDRVLSAQLGFRLYDLHRPITNKLYTFMVDKQKVRVRFTENHLENLTAGPHTFGAVRPRQPFRVRFSDLKKTAKFLDKREKELGNRVHWVTDLAKTQYGRVDGIGAQAQIILSDEIEIDGFFHMAGIVSSGKTTLAILICAYIILDKLDIRITFVVGDTNSAVQLAHRLNTWFCNDPADDELPVAVPILGQSTRNIQLNRLLVSREYQASKTADRPHWGERWLNPVCPLQALVEWTSDDINHIPIGQEPCQRLHEENAPTKYPKNHVCPFFSTCPSKQMYRDMPTAKIWITTPGALSQSGVPHHLEDRRIKIGDLVYEQSDLVIFDEAETIVDWFDHVYAQNLVLTNAHDGLVDRLDGAVTEYLKGHRSPVSEYQKWLFAERAATKAISGVLTTLDKNQSLSSDCIRMWVKSGQFTRNGLSYRLSRRLAGLKEYEGRTDITAEQRRAEEQQTLMVLRIFEILNDIDTPLQQHTPPSNADPEAKAAYALTGIMQQMNNLGVDVDNTFTLNLLCAKWIDDFFPNIQTQLDALKARLESSESPIDRDYAKKDFQLDRTTQDLALRLVFTLWVIVLDWHSDIVFKEWHRKPPEINVEQPFSRIPRNLRNILPIPAMGGQFGLYRVDKPTQKNNNPNYLTQFVHINIGRAYVLNFHQLRTDLEGWRGPNVLAMSGTSYLPDSSRFNLQVPPSGVLLPDARIKTGIAQSHFEFKSFYHEDKPIIVSGDSKKLLALNRMINAMLENDPSGGFFGEILEQLRKKAESDPDQWADRGRLLLFTNSYEQSKKVALTLQKLWPAMAKHIFYLCQGRENQDYEVESEGTIQRVDIEQFCETGGKILVAPMQSIGRGFNILNKNRPIPLAAFGAVFFLIRPMWQPEELVTMAQEINRYTVEWAEATDSLPNTLESVDGLYKGAITLRDTARKLWHNIELRYGYHALSYDQEDGTSTDLHPELRIAPRRDLAATTVGLIIQAIGRLLRGGVPFYAYFTDAAWAPITAKEGRSVKEEAATSLLQAMIDILTEYAGMNEVGNALYGDLAERLCEITGLNNN
jgi:hypothetical protein